MSCYRDDCEVHRTGFCRRNIALTANRKVNHDIIPEPNLGGLATAEWLLSPPVGDCNNYAVAKRYELLARGWRSRALLLSEVVVASLVLIVRMKDVDRMQGRRPGYRTISRPIFGRVSCPIAEQCEILVDRERTIPVAYSDADRIGHSSKQLRPQQAGSVIKRLLLLNGAALALGES